MRIGASTIEEMLAAVPPDRRTELEIVDRVIRDAAPELERQLYAGPSITMIGYGSMDWQNRSGQGVWPLIGMASQKQYISLYVAASKDGQTIAEHYRDRLGTTNNGKGCIRFRRTGVVDLEILADAVRDAVAWAAERSGTYGRACASPAGEQD